MFKLNALGYCPVLFLGHRGRNGQLQADVMHHVQEPDLDVGEILQKMGKLYEHLLKSEMSKIIILQFTVV